MFFPTMSVVRSSFPVGLATLQNLTTAQSIPISACKLHDGHFSMYASANFVEQ